MDKKKKISGKGRTQAKSARLGQATLLPRHEWNYTKPMWVLGTIDSHGAIRARATGDTCMHAPEDGSGSRWRWNVWGAEFHAVLGGRYSLTAEECEAVEDWLINHDYIHPDKQHEIAERREWHKKARPVCSREKDECEQEKKESEG